MIVKKWLFQMCRTSNKKKETTLSWKIEGKKKKLIVP